MCFDTNMIIIINNRIFRQEHTPKHIGRVLYSWFIMHTMVPVVGIYKCWSIAETVRFTNVTRTENFIVSAYRRRTLVSYAECFTEHDRSIFFFHLTINLFKIQFLEFLNIIMIRSLLFFNFWNFSLKPTIYYRGQCPVDTQISVFQMTIIPPFNYCKLFSG